MSAVAAHLAPDLVVRRETRITQVARRVTAWDVTGEADTDLGCFEYLVVTLPAPQAAELLGRHPLAAIAAAVPMAPCWAVLVAFDRRYEVPWDGAFVHGSPLSWVCRNGSKPGRKSSPDCPDCWVLHASPEWSANNLEDTPELVAPRLLEALAAATGVEPPTPVHLSAHRWRFSQGSDPTDRRALFDPTTGLVVCGDWLAGGRVEGAFLAGVAAAGHILRRIGIKPSRETLF